MTSRRKRVLPNWMKGSPDSDASISIRISGKDGLSPKPTLNCTLFDSSSNELVEGDLCITAEVVEPLCNKNILRYLTINKDGAKDETNNTRTSSADSFSDNEEIRDKNISNDNKIGTSVEINTAQKLSINNETDEEDGADGSSPHSTPLSQNIALVLGADHRINSSASTSASPATRRSCFYGSSCYRKNPHHRGDFAHPGDPDYCDDSSSRNSGINSGQTATLDVRPLCEYGSACYRKNPQHRRDFRHDTPKKRNARPADLQDIPSDDDGDFNSDGGSDNYNPGESESDDSFVTSDSVTDGNSDYDPEEEDQPKKRKKTLKRKGEKKKKK